MSLSVSASRSISARWPTPRRQYVQITLPRPANAYVDARSCHSGPANSASICTTALGLPVVGRHRFHQFDRSETKNNSPPGDHSG